MPRAPARSGPTPFYRRIVRCEVGGSSAGSLTSGATLLVAPRRRAPEERSYRIRLRDTQRATIGSDCILEPHVDRKSGTCRFSAVPNSRYVLPTDRAIADLTEALRLDPQNAGLAADRANLQLRAGRPEAAPSLISPPAAAPAPRVAASPAPVSLPAELPVTHPTPPPGTPPPAITPTPTGTTAAFIQIPVMDG